MCEQTLLGYVLQVCQIVSCFENKFQPPRICYVVNHIYGSDLDVSYDASLSS